MVEVHLPQLLFSNSSFVAAYHVRIDDRKYFSHSAGYEIVND
jgi:hypothetical protein